MIPAKYDFTLYQGDEFEMVIRLRTSTTTVETLTGLVGRSQIRATPDAGVMAEFDVDVLEQGKDRGKVRMFLPVDQAALLVPGKAVYDLVLSNADGTGAKTRLAGNITIKPRVTR